MRRRFVTVFAALSLLAAASAEARPRRSAAPPARFDVPAARTAVQSAMANGLPGAIVAVRHRGATYVEAFGVSDKEAGTPMRWDAALQLASVSKQFTAAAILRLADEGRLRLSDPIRMYLPELNATYEPITIEQMLNHTSGLPDYDVMLTDLWTPMTHADVVKLITSKPLDYTPGTSWAYSNSGYFLAAMIVERATGQNFYRYLDEAFFTPLGMTSIGECGAVPDGYVRSPFDGSLSRIPPTHPSVFLGAGALCSNVYDLLQWNDALITGRVISAESFAKMRTPVIPNAPFPYGLGVISDRLDGKHTRIWHNGLLFGYMSHLAWYPDLDLSIAVLVNQSGRQDNATTIADAIARALAR